MSVRDREFLDEVKRERKKLLPGPFTNVKTDLEVKARLRKHVDKFFGYPDCIGKYHTHDSGHEGGGYLANVNIVIDNPKELVTKYGLAQVLAACEKSLNSCVSKKSGKKILGEVTIVSCEDSRTDRDECFFSCTIRTTRRHIPKFMGVKMGANKEGKLIPVLQVF